MPRVWRTPNASSVPIATAASDRVIAFEFADEGDFDLGHVTGLVHDNFLLKQGNDAAKGRNNGDKEHHQSQNEAGSIHPLASRLGKRYLKSAAVANIGCKVRNSARDLQR
jgi:hypothetical protein